MLLSLEQLCLYVSLWWQLGMSAWESEYMVMITTGIDPHYDFLWRRKHLTVVDSKIPVGQFSILCMIRFPVISQSSWTSVSPYTMIHFVSFHHFAGQLNLHFVFCRAQYKYDGKNLIEMKSVAMDTDYCNTWLGTKRKEPNNQSTLLQTANSGTATRPQKFYIMDQDYMNSSTLQAWLQCVVAFFMANSMKQSIYIYLCMSSSLHTLYTIYMLCHIFFFFNILICIWQSNSTSLYFVDNSFSLTCFKMS